MKITTTFLLFFIFITFVSFGQTRKIIHIPNIDGYLTLKCDFHTHTIFSDGTVWPTVRIKEAWQEGLDAISITDHIEYRPHSKEIIADHNRSFEIAEPLSKNLNIILIKGAEITRNMPPGHFNTLFIKNANLLERDNVFDAIREARDQGAFIIWNHPGWKIQQPDSTTWWEEHTYLLKNDMLHGIEIFNNNKLYPEAIKWSREKQLTIFANTDIHGPTATKYDLSKQHRPMTLVFSKSRTPGGIKEALFNRRTLAYYNNTLIGETNLLEPLFFASLQINISPGILKNEESKIIEITNNSDIDYNLELVQPGIGFDAPESIELTAHRATIIELNGNSEQVMNIEELKIYYEVTNLKITDSDNLIVTFIIKNN